MWSAGSDSVRPWHDSPLRAGRRSIPVRCSTCGNPCVASLPRNGTASRRSSCSSCSRRSSGARMSRRRSEEHTSELQSQSNLVCRLLLEKKKKRYIRRNTTIKPRHHSTSKTERRVVNRQIIVEYRKPDAELHSIDYEKLVVDTYCSHYIC